MKKERIIELLFQKHVLVHRSR